MHREKRMTTKIREAVMAALLLSLLPAMVAADPAVSPYPTNPHIAMPTIMHPRPLVPTPALPWPSSTPMRPISPVPYDIRARPYSLWLHTGGYAAVAPSRPMAVPISPCASSWPFNRKRPFVPRPTAPDPYQMSGVHPRWAAYNPLNRVTPGVRAGCRGWR